MRLTNVHHALDEIFDMRAAGGGVSIMIGCALWVLLHGSMAMAQEADATQVQVFPTESTAQIKDARRPDAMDTIIVTATRAKMSIQDAPMAISVLDASDFETPHQGLGLDEWLAQVPGLYFENRYNFAQNLRVSTRGFGARAAFGIRGIRLITDGFPDTLPDGQAQVDGIDLLSLRGAEIIRGPSSVLYGNASGGVIALTTEDGAGLPGVLQTQFDLGADGFRRMGVQAGKDVGLWHGWVSVSDLSYEGQRAHSATDKRLLNAHGVVRLSDRQSLRAVVGVLDQPFGQDPGALTIDQVAEDRWQASAQSESLNAGQSVMQTRLGLQYQLELPPNQLFSAYVFGLDRAFEQQLPSSFFPSLITYQREFSGGGLSFSQEYAGGWRWTMGVESAKQSDDRQRFGVNRQGQIVSQTQDELQVARVQAAFMQSSWTGGPWSLLMGLRADELRLSIDDRQVNDDLGYSKRVFSPLSLMGGATYQFNPWLNGFINLGEGFESPSFTEIKDLSGGGGFTRALAPAKALNKEVGLRAKWSSGDLQAHLFWVDTKDEVVIVDAFDGVDIFGNAGRTDRRGFELSAQQSLGPSIEWQWAYTYADYRFEEFLDAGRSFDGNTLPGLPDHTIYTSIEFALTERWSVWADGLAVSQRFADNANEDRVPGHETVNLKMHYRQMDVAGGRIDWVLGVNNVFNARYFSNIRINANRKAYYESAPSRAWFAGMTWVF